MSESQPIPLPIVRTRDTQALNSLDRIYLLTHCVIPIFGQQLLQDYRHRLANPLENVIAVRLSSAIWSAAVMPVNTLYMEVFSDLANRARLGPSHIKGSYSSDIMAVIPVVDQYSVDDERGWWIYFSQPTTVGELSLTAGTVAPLVAYTPLTVPLNELITFTFSFKVLPITSK